MKRVAVIVAGGAGTRMGKDLPKQFLEINGKAILLHAIEAFKKAFSDIHIVVVLPKDYFTHANEILLKQHYPFDVELAEGGPTRFDSVKNGLQHIKDGEILFVHDAVRCLVTPALIQACSAKAEEKGTAIPVVPVRDSMRRISTDGASAIVDRNQLVVVQTPQTFKREILLPAFDVSYSPSFTDEASVVEAKGYSVDLIPGEESNIKITYPEDLAYAEWRLNRE